MSIFDYVKSGLDYAKEYQDLIKIGGSAGKAYLDYKDQKRRNELDEKAYKDYLAQVEAAGQEAQAAIDINLSPMEVTGVPTSKADVTSFQKVARGGIIGLKNGGDPNAGITALRKKAPGVVKRMGFAMGTDPEDDPYDGMSVMEIMKLEGYPTAVESEFEEEFGTSPFESKKNKKNTDMQIAEIPKDLTYEDAVKIFKLSNDRDPISIDELLEFFKNRKLSAKGGIANLKNGGRPGYMMGEGPVMDESVKLMVGVTDKNNTDGTVKIEDAVSETENMKIAGKYPYDVSKMSYNTLKKHFNSAELPGLSGSDYSDEELRLLLIDLDGAMYFDSRGMFKGGIANLKNGGFPDLNKDGKVTKADVLKGRGVFNMGGGVMDLGGMEKDYRFNGGFVPIGEYEKKDDVPARLSKNEFVFTADAVRAAGGGSINKGAKRMYDTMKKLEAKPTAKRMTA